MTDRSTALPPPVDDATAPVSRERADRGHGQWFSARGPLPIALVLAAGVALRVLMQVEHHPAFVTPSSADYLASAHRLVPSPLHPSGYALFLRLVPYWRDLWPIVVVQHLLGLAMGALGYVVLRRRGLPAWGAALAAAPVLVDPWQVTVEHDVLPDVVFEALLVGICAWVALRRRLALWEAATIGLLAGVAVTVRAAGLLLFVPLALALLLGQARWRAALVTFAAFVVPVAGYVGWYHAVEGPSALAAGGYREIYGRVATFVDCRGLTLPPAERSLCPTVPVAARPGAWAYSWSPTSPVARYRPPPGHTLEGDLADFDRKAIAHQPLAYTASAARDFGAGFAPTRAKAATPAGWGGFYFPGPLFAACLVAGLAAVAGVGRSRVSGLRSSIGAYAGTALSVLVVAAATAQFSWHQQVPQLALLPAAGALGCLAMWRPQLAASGQPALDGRQVTLRLTERLPLPAPLRELVTGEHRLRVGRYFMGSVICTVISTVTFLVAFGAGLLGSRASSLLSSATGALAGYYLNRTWTWGRRGRASWRRELLPYWATIIATAVAAALVTGAVNHVVASITDHHGVRTVFDAAAFLGTYVAFFVLKYVVFNRLFGERRRPADGPD